MKPPWIKVRAPGSHAYRETSDLLERYRVNTVCRSACCPNIAECFAEQTATFLLLGDVCTRSCRFCAVKQGSAAPVDVDEPERVARSIRELGLGYAVLTSVTRDDLADGGASQFARTAERIKELSPGCGVELLVPDFHGDLEAVGIVARSPLDVLAHNLETVPSLYSRVRTGACYLRSLELLQRAKLLLDGRPSKSGLMLGLGEDMDEVLLVLRDLRQVGCDIITLGQYLRPSPMQLPVHRYLPPVEFQELKMRALEMGFLAVEAGPLVRSSYHAQRTASVLPKLP